MRSSWSLTPDGDVRCWGSREWAQLGDALTAISPVPVSVAGLNGVIALAAGDRHTCAIVGSGEVRCWGGNAAGQLGDGSRA